MGFVIKDKLVQLLKDEWRLLRVGYVQFAQAAYTSPKFKFYCLIFVLAVSSVFYDPQILYACFLVFLGFAAGKAIGPHPLYALALAMLPLLTINEWTRKLQFSFTDTNYTAYIFYLLIAPLVLYRSKAERVSGWLNFLLIIPALLSLSRGAILASFALLLYANKRYARYSLVVVLVVAPLVYGFIYPERAGSDAERLYIWQQILEGKVFYANGDKFLNLYVYSPIREDHLLHLHNTPVTWLIHVSQSIVSTALYVALLFCVRVVSFLLLIPSFFLTVAPGPFYLLFGLSLGASNPFRRS